eukprot:1441007-Pyramimonas_sp.AAC.1
MGRGGGAEWERAEILLKDAIKSGVKEYVGHRIAQGFGVRGGASGPMDTEAITALEDQMFPPGERATPADRSTTL